MTSATLWIFIPIGLGAFLLAIYKRVRLAGAIGSIGVALLALLAWRAPIGSEFGLGPWTLEIAPNLEILGRSFIITDADRPIITFLYLFVFLWFLGGLFIADSALFIPLGLGVTSLFVAALSVEPFLYAALLIETAILLSVPMLVLPGSRPGQGIYRYLIFQTLGMPFILFTGWMLTGVESGVGGLTSVVRAGITLGFGFAFLLAIFPFYTWIPLLAEEGDPYSTGFILAFHPVIVILFGIAFLDRYAWLRDSESVFSVLVVSGVLMIITGGIWAAFQNHLGRIFGYAVIVETGFSLIAAGVGNHSGYQPFMLLFFPRMVSLGMWALSLSVLLQRCGTLDLRQMGGIGYRLPIIASCLLLAHLSIVGFPLLANFPSYVAVLRLLIDSSALHIIGVFVGVLGLLLAALRTLAVFTREAREAYILDRTIPGRFHWDTIYLVGGIALQFVLGTFPQIIYPLSTGLIRAFEMLSSGG